MEDFRRAWLAPWAQGRPTYTRHQVETIFTRYEKSPAYGAQGMRYGPDSAAGLHAAADLRGYPNFLRKAVTVKNTSLRGMGEIISRDIGLATGILKLVNSSFFGLPHRVSSTEQAVTLLGIETLRALVLSHYLFSRFDTRRYPGFGLEHLWNHSLGVARCARAMTISPPDSPK